jgi:hypothetical protein
MPEYRWLPDTVQTASTRNTEQRKHDAIARIRVEFFMFMSLPTNFAGRHFKKLFKLFQREAQQAGLFDKICNVI